MSKHTAIVIISALIILIPLLWGFISLAGAGGIGVAILMLFIFGPFAIVAFAIPYAVGCYIFDKPGRLQIKFRGKLIKPRLPAAFDNPYEKRSLLKYYYLILVAYFLSFVSALFTFLSPVEKSNHLNLLLWYLIPTWTFTILTGEFERYRLISYLTKNFKEMFGDIYYIPFLNFILSFQLISDKKSVFNFYKFLFSSDDLGDETVGYLKTTYRGFICFRFLVIVSFLIIFLLLSTIST